MRRISVLFVPVYCESLEQFQQKITKRVEHLVREQREYVSHLGIELDDLYASSTRSRVELEYGHWAVARICAVISVFVDRGFLGFDVYFHDHDKNGRFRMHVGTPFWCSKLVHFSAEHIGSATFPEHNRNQWLLEALRNYCNREFSDRWIDWASLEVTIPRIDLAELIALSEDKAHEG